MGAMALFHFLPFLPWLFNGRRQECDSCINGIKDHPISYFYGFVCPIFLVTLTGMILMIVHLVGISNYTSDGTEIVNNDFTKINPCFDVNTRINPNEYIPYFEKIDDLAS